jgi:hypothetical protein
MHWREGDVVEDKGEVFFCFDGVLAEKCVHCFFGVYKKAEAEDCDALKSEN